MRDSVVFYRSFYEAVKDLPPKQFKECVQAIMDYGLDGTEPSGNGIEKTIFLLSKPQIDANNRRYLNGKKGGRPRNQNQEITKTEPSSNQRKTKEEPNDNQEITIPEPKEKEKDKEKVKKEIPSNEGIKKPRPVFVPPTVENVSGYCQESGYSIDAERFVDFYASKGWMVGKSRMKDWRAAVRNWARQEKQTPVPRKTSTDKYNSFMQNSYDYDALEQELLGGVDDAEKV